jgi:hypothetical protein
MQNDIEANPILRANSHKLLRSIYLENPNGLTLRPIRHVCVAHSLQEILGRKRAIPEINHA